MNLENLDLIELDVQEVLEVEGGMRWQDRRGSSNMYDGRDGGSGWFYIANGDPNAWWTNP